ncbi:armadillo-type protein [Russula aff. rugulosa BPL654]|nr:armadillo-type protein [Russula aff. rugulosa BPL654]
MILNFGSKDYSVIPVRQGNKAGIHHASAPSMAVIDEADTTSITHPPLPSSSHYSFPDELSYLITSFTPTHDYGKRSKAFLVLASYCQGVRASMGQTQDDAQDPGAQALSRIFLPIVQARIAEAQESDVVVGLSFLTALFQVDWKAASEVFQKEVVLTSITDILDLYPSELVSREAARLLSQACGHKACRSSLTAETTQWLEAAVRQKKDVPLRAIAAVAITKLSRGAGTDALAVSVGASKQSVDQDLVELMKGILTEDRKDSSLDAVEGLAYMSVEPSVKEDLSNDSPFLKKLFSFIPTGRRTSSTPSDASNHSLIYGILNIIHYLSVYRPPISPDQEQVMKLRRMAKPGATSSQGPEENVLEDDQHVRERGGTCDGVRLTVGRILLNLSVDKENRGKILQSGGARTLGEIIRKALSAKQSEVDVSILEPVQALAKLAITSSPTQVFGPDPGAVYDAIRPFAILLTHPESSLLQRFEAIMALTNLSSQGVEAAGRVAQADGLLTKIEFLMLEDHVLIRRAATELICNLVACSDSVFKRYSDGNAAKSRLHILVALSDVEDLPTRLAASGALASLTHPPTRVGHCTNWSATIVGPWHGSSGVVCIRNLFINLEPTLRERLKEESDLTGILNVLIAVTKSNAEKPEILQPTTEALKCLMDLGVLTPNI